jgi:uncharacterized protein
MITVATSPTRQRLPDVLWCVLVPLGIMALYLGVGVGLVSLIGESIMGTVVLGGITLLVVLAVRLLRPGWFNYQPAARPRSEVRPVGWFIAGSTVLAFFAGQALAVWLYSLDGSATFDQTTQLRQDAGLLAVLLLTLVAAPVGEEALFRGLLYPLLRRRVGIIASVLVTTAVFAVMHGNPIQFAAALPLAVLLGLVYERTRALWPCVLVHLAFNVAATFVPPAVIVPLANPISVLLLLAAFGGCMVVFYLRVTGKTLRQAAGQNSQVDRAGLDLADQQGEEGGPRAG